MRLVMRFSMLLAIAGLAWSQAITDAAGVVAGGSVGVGAGKKVSEGVTNVMRNVGATTASAGKKNNDGIVTTGPAKPVTAKAPSADSGPGAGGGAGGGGAVVQTGPGGVVKDHSLVPPPPPVRRAAVVPPPPPIAPAPAVFKPVVVLPPPRMATRDDLKTLANGTAREDVLKLGAPSSRITMFDDGHLLEIYRYQAGDATFGIVRLSDGSVSNIQLP
jgi:hypothetical protein